MKKLLKIDNNLFEELSYEEIVERYTPFLNKKVADYTRYYNKKYFKHNYAFSAEDLYQIALMSTFKAYETYDIDKDVLFFSHLINNVMHGFSRYSRDTTRIRNMGTNQYLYQEIPLDGMYENSDGKENIRIEDKISSNYNLEESIINKLMTKKILNNLNEKEKKVVKLYFFKGMKQVDIGKVIGTRQVQVSRILNKSLKKMKEELECNEERIMNYMPKIKIKTNHEKVMEYFKNNLNLNNDFIESIKKCSNEINVSPSIIISILKKEPEIYKKIKGVEKVKVNEIKNNFIEIQSKDIIENVANIVENNVKNSVENPFSDIKINNISLTMNYCEPLINEKEINLNIKSNVKTKQDLIMLKNEIDKIINMYDYLYKM